MPNPTQEQLAELQALKGAIPLAKFWKDYGLPKSTVYTAADSGELETVTTATGQRLVPPAAALRYLTAGGDRSARVKGAAKQRQQAALGGQGAAA